MDNTELRWKIIKFFNDQAQVYITSPTRIEVDVSKEISTDEWKRCADTLGFTDNSKVMPNSYKYNNVTIMFFYGPLQKFNQRKQNWNPFQPHTLQTSTTEVTQQ